MLPGVRVGVGDLDVVRHRQVSEIMERKTTAAFDVVVRR
jgi:hypothetical protein